MLTREDVISKVEKFSNEILLSGFPLEKVVLFGSFAKGMQNADSDIDVALVSPSFSGFGFEDRKFFSKINIKKEFSIIEVKTFPSAYFEIGDPFTKEIIDTGIVLFNKKYTA
jgi:uncharacterized protein